MCLLFNEEIRSNSTVKLDEKIEIPAKSELNVKLNITNLQEFSKNELQIRLLCILIMPNATW